MIFFLKKMLLTLKFDSRHYFPANIYLFNINNRNTAKTCEIWSKLTIKTPKQFQ